jgi:hypothetical protein
MAIRKLHLPREDLFILLTLLVAGWRYTRGLEQILDIGLDDESAYLYAGVRLQSAGLPGAQEAPLYAVWYFMLSLLHPDRVALYYANYKILTWLLPAAAYLLLRRYRVSITPAAVVSFLLLIAPANLPVWPKVAHFSLLLIIGLLILASFTESLSAGTALTCIGALLSSYVRPEMFLSFVLLALLYAALLTTEFKRRRPPGVLAPAAVVLSAWFLIATLGLPVGGGRGFVAFGQHFALNWTHWTHSDLNPWTNWGEIVSQNFGDARSLGGAMSGSPSIFTEHLVSNLIHVPVRLLGLFYNHPDFFPGRLQTIQAWALLVLLSTCAFLSRGRLFSRLKGAGERIRVLWLCCFIVPPLAAAVVIFPRDHYLLVPGVLMIIGAAASVLGGTTHLGLKGKQLVFFSALVVGVAPGPSYHLGSQTGLKNLETIELLRSLRITDEVNMLEAEGGYYFYLGDNFHRIAEYDKDENFDSFLRDKRINMIVLTHRLRNDSRFSGDKEWQDFLVNYETLGYTAIEIPNNHGQIIVARGLSQH